MNRVVDVCVIGGGAAGISAALSAKKNGAKNVLLLERDLELGGILRQCIHNGFGLHHYKEELTGPEYAERMSTEMFNTDVEVKTETTVIKITEDRDVHYMNENDGYEVINAKSIVLAVGCMERTRYQIDIPGKRLAGIMTAGLAQRYLNMDGYLVGKRVLILGSGDIGLIMARRMTLEGADVLGVVEVMPYSNGLNRNIVQCLDDYGIPLYLSHTVTKVGGSDRLNSVTIAKVDNRFDPIKGTEIKFKVDTLLLSVGLIPETSLLKELNVALNDLTKGAYVDDGYQTNIKGIFACGNTLHVHDVVDYVSEEGSEAGKNAALYSLQEVKHVLKTVSVKGLNHIRYVIPNKIKIQDKSQDSNVEDYIHFKFRVTEPIKRGTVVIKYGSKIIKKVKKAHLLPAEMETVHVNKSSLGEQEQMHDVTIQIDEGD